MTPPEHCNYTTIQVEEPGALVYVYSRFSRANRFQHLLLLDMPALRIHSSNITAPAEGYLFPIHDFLTSHRPYEPTKAA